MEPKFTCSKVFEGFSTCFRQHRATHSHCRFLHGYGVSFKVTFECTYLDDRNWVLDFGLWKKTKYTIQGMSPGEWFKWLLDHTVIVSEEDPALEYFKKLDEEGIIQLRTIPETGCEKFAEFLLKNINEFLSFETEGRARAISVEFREHSRNEATASLWYEESL